MNKSDNIIGSSRRISNIQMICGVVIAVMFCIIALNMMFDNHKQNIFLIIAAWVFTLCGMELVRAGMNRKKLLKVFITYATCLAMEPTGSIAKIAEYCGHSENYVRENMRYLIKKKYFRHAYIDEETDCVIIDL